MIDWPAWNEIGGAPASETRIHLLLDDKKIVCIQLSGSRTDYKIVPELINFFRFCFLLSRMLWISYFASC